MNHGLRQTQEPKLVVIVDDHPVMRAGIACCLATEDGLEVVGEAGSVAEGCAVVNDLAPDLVIADFSLPDGDGIDLMRELNANGHEHIPKLVLSMHDESILAPRVLWAGARGYLMKESASVLLIDAVWALLRGETYVSSKLAQQFQSMNRGETGHSRERPDLANLLDATSYKIYHMLGAGKTIMGIAGHLGLSIQEVEQRLESCRRKLQLEDHCALVRNAVQWVANQQARDVRSFLKMLEDDVPTSGTTQSEKMPNDG
jgi:DNA-binding NarL/FixJ family response regulator